MRTMFCYAGDAAGRRAGRICDHTLACYRRIGARRGSIGGAEGPVLWRIRGHSLAIRRQLAERGEAFGATTEKWRDSVARY